jgi:hypothetical protein
MRYPRSGPCPKRCDQIESIGITLTASGIRLASERVHHLCFQVPILFPELVTSNERYWVISAKRRRRGRCCRSAGPRVCADAFVDSTSPIAAQRVQFVGRPKGTPGRGLLKTSLQLAHVYPHPAGHRFGRAFLCSLLGPESLQEPTDPPDIICRSISHFTRRRSIWAGRTGDADRTGSSRSIAPDIARSKSLAGGQSDSPF